MNHIHDWPTAPDRKSCLDCVHHQYEEGEEEIEILVCYFFRKPVRTPEVSAIDCNGYYTGKDE